LTIKKTSSEKRISYYLLTPLKGIEDDVYFISKFFIISLLITFAIGILCVYFLLKKNYRPVADLYVKIFGELHRGNEFRQLENEYEKMAGAKNPFGDGFASERIVEAILYSFGLKNERPQDYR